MKQVASASERNNAVVQGQENLEGVKELKIKRVLKKNSDSEYVVTESRRTEMVYDTPESATDAYENIHDAKEEVEFEDNGDNMEESTENKTEKEAAYTAGMNIADKYTVCASDVTAGRLLVKANGKIGWVKEAFLTAVAKHPELELDVEKGQIVPADTGTKNPKQTAPEVPLNFDNGVTEGEVEKFVGPAGYAIDVPPSPGASSMVGQADSHMSLIQPNFPVSELENELKLGVNRELEHVDDPAKALEIAIDHLAEDKQYYTKLNMVLPEYGPEEKPERDVCIKDASNGIPEYDYEKACREYMCQGTTTAAVNTGLPVSGIIDSCVDKLAELALSAWHHPVITPRDEENPDYYEENYYSTPNRADVNKLEDAIPTGKPAPEVDEEQMRKDHEYDVASIREKLHEFVDNSDWDSIYSNLKRIREALQENPDSEYLQDYLNVALEFVNKIPKDVSAAHQKELDDAYTKKENEAREAEKNKDIAAHDKALDAAKQIRMKLFKSDMLPKDSGVFPAGVDSEKSYKEIEHLIHVLETNADDVADLFSEEDKKYLTDTINWAHKIMRMSMDKFAPEDTDYFTYEYRNEPPAWYVDK